MRAPSSTLVSCARDPPYGVADVVGDEQRAGSVHRDSHRTSHRVSVLLDESRQHVDRLAGRHAMREWDEDHLVSAAWLSIPRPVLANEHSAVERSWEGCRARPGESERCGVWAERVIRDDGALDQIRPLRMHARIDVLAVITEWPAVESPFPNRRDVIRHEIAAKLVALVNGDPELVCLRLPGEPDGIPKTRREDAMTSSGWIYLPDVGATFLLPDTVLPRVTVRSDRCVELGSVGTGDDVLRPGMIDAARGEGGGPAPRSR